MAKSRKESAVPVSVKQVNDIAHIDFKQINKSHEKNRSSIVSIEDLMSLYQKPDIPYASVHSLK